MSTLRILVVTALVACGFGCTTKPPPVYPASPHPRSPIPNVDLPYPPR
ncbi:MAG: hypothetical protein KIT31_07035 [Deltaproteobacteria bacterium]|nr:hypothetical protein [Deltaproteobacteria bacterium]